MVFLGLDEIINNRQVQEMIFGITGKGAAQQGFDKPMPFPRVAP